MSKKKVSDISQEVGALAESQFGQLMEGFSSLPPETQSSLLGKGTINVFCGRNDNCRGANCSAGCGSGSEPETDGMA